MSLLKNLVDVSGGNLFKKVFSKLLKLLKCVKIYLSKLAISTGKLS